MSAPLSLEFDVTVTASAPLAALEPATREAVQALIDAARAEALRVLDGLPVLRTDLVDAIRAAVDAQRRVEGSSGMGRIEARLAFRSAIETLKTRFEEEFPS